MQIIVQDIVLTMSRDAQTDSRTQASTDEQNKNSMPMATLRWAKA